MGFGERFPDLLGCVGQGQANQFDVGLAAEDFLRDRIGPVFKINQLLAQRAAIHLGIHKSFLIPY